MKKTIKFVLYLVGILYLPTIVVMSLFADQSGSFFKFSPLLLMLIILLISLHFFCGFLEIGFTVLRFFEKKARTRGEKILNISTISIAVVMLVLAFIAPDNIDVLAIILSQVLVVLWILGDIIFSQKKILSRGL